MHVFLDIGFTLIGGPEIGPSAWLARELGLPSAAKAELKSWLFTTDLSAPEILADRLSEVYRLDRAHTRRVVGGFWDRQIQDAYPLPGAERFLTELERANLPYAFITNIWTPFLMGFARCFPQAFERVPLFASCRLGLAKPDAALYQKALEGTGVRPEQAVMIGDTYEMDLAPALRLGMKGVWLLHRPAKETTDLVAVLNQRAPCPDLTLSGIDVLTPEHLSGLFPATNPANPANPVEKP
ncbi:MAG: HAD hydrolase-like protein [Magnetococcales bacterium]|nr:HAD hydrolase-like protein [Magnetococcales bacterium]